LAVNDPPGAGCRRSPAWLGRLDWRSRNPPVVGGLLSIGHHQLAVLRIEAVPEPESHARQ
jgi:hypothetical protein